ncbi:MAG: diguanylate cyclase [Clostridia bacterium]
MNNYSLLSFFAFIVYVYLGFYTYNRAPKAKANKIFLALCSGLAVWAFSYTFIYDAPNNNMILLLRSCAAIGWGTYISIILHLALVLTYEENILHKKWIYTVLYLPSLVFLSAFYIYILPQGDVISREKISYYAFFNIYVVIYAIFSLLIIWRWGKSSQSNREKKQARIIVYTGMISILLSIMFEIILPLLEIHVVSRTAQIIFLIYAYGMWYAISHLNLMSVTSCIRAEELIDKMVDWVLLLDSRGRILRMNRKIHLELGYNEEELLGKPMSTVFDLNSLQDMELMNFDSSQPSFEEKNMHIITKRKKKLPVKACLSDICDKAGDIIGYIAIAQDMRSTMLLEEEIRERKQAEERLKFFSMHDITTRLYNRFYFQQHMERLEQEQECPVGLVVCDVDALKLVNDTLGHQCGDDLIVAAATLLKQCFGERGIVCRIGGDEFGILMPHCTVLYIENLCCKFKESIIRYNSNKPDIPLNVSIGFQVRESIDMSMVELFKKADDRMYFYKKQNSQNVRKDIIDKLTKTLNITQIDQEEEEWTRLRQLFSYRNE